MSTERKRVSKWDVHVVDNAAEKAKEAATKVNSLLVAQGKLSGVHKDLANVVQEVVINNYSLNCRNILTKGTVQDEIAKSSSAAISTKGRYFNGKHFENNIFNDRPLFLKLQAGDQVSVNKAVLLIHQIISTIDHIPLDLLQNNNVPSRIQPQMFEEKIFVGLEHAPAVFNVRSKIEGPGGNYLLHIATETKATISLMGRGSTFLQHNPMQVKHPLEPMHILIRHENLEGLREALELAVNLVQTVQREYAQYQEQLAAANIRHPARILSENSGLSALQSPPNFSIPPPFPHMELANNNNIVSDTVPVVTTASALVPNPPPPGVTIVVTSAGPIKMVNGEPLQPVAIISTPTPKPQPANQYMPGPSFLHPLPPRFGNVYPDQPKPMSYMYDMDQPAQMMPGDFMADPNRATMHNNFSPVSKNIAQFSDMPMSNFDHPSIQNSNNQHIQQNMPAENNPNQIMYPQQPQYEPTYPHPAGPYRNIDSLYYKRDVTSPSSGPLCSNQWSYSSKTLMATSSYSNLKRPNFCLPSQPPSKMQSLTERVDDRLKESLLMPPPAPPPDTNSLLNSSIESSHSSSCSSPVSSGVLSSENQLFNPHLGGAHCQTASLYSSRMSSIAQETISSRNMPVSSSAYTNTTAGFGLGESNGSFHKTHVGLPSIQSSLPATGYRYGTGSGPRLAYSNL